MAATVSYVPQEQIERFRELQDLPYRIKIPYAIGKAQEFYEVMEGKVFCSVGGPENAKYGTNYRTAPFKVSPDCCYYMKEKPADDFAKKNGLYPYIGLMASEGGQREKALIKNGCNYYGKTVTRSCPFAIFNRQDILQLALDLEAPVPEIYGEIVRDPDGTLRTTKAQRTGCTMCGFGIHIEKRPHRFDRLRETNYKEWRFWMYDMGWGQVLDYIGVKWENEYIDYQQQDLFCSNY